MTVRSDQLEQALRTFIEQASLYLQGQLDRGAEIPFELASSSTRGGLRTPLYSYRPLTGDFVIQHASALRALDGYTPAVHLIAGAEGLERYLHSRGVSRVPASSGKCAEEALLALLGDVFAEQSDFEIHPQRTQMALERLRQSARASSHELNLLASLHGMTLSSSELALTKGLALIQPDAFQGAPEQLQALGDHEPHLLVLFTSNDPDIDSAVAQGREVLEDLLRALRLFGDGRLALGQMAWTRVGGGTWNPLALGGKGRPHGMLLITPEQEDELRAFCNLVSRRAPHDNELAWALRRFELGCEREDSHEALSDYLMAMHVLLDCVRPGGGHDENLLARRLAALCATVERREELAAKVLQAHALQRAVIDGTAVPNAAGNDLVNTIADNLRALLRDVICGHLDPDLGLLADELLASDQGQPEPCQEDQIAKALGISTGPAPAASESEPYLDPPWEAETEEPVGAPV